MRVGIIGIACRFPGADNPRDFWNNLVAGVDSIREIPPERWDTRRYYSPNIGEANKANSKWCGLIEDIDQFDQRFFGISPREAKNMDPQQRIVLEETWHCIEDSGIALTTLQQAKTAVYVGVMGNDYQIASCTATIPTDSYAALGNYHSILANRISYAFGLNGASQSINTACSASLVALHQAKAALRAGEADYAIVAGVNLNIHPWKYISFSKSRMLSPDGHCKTFDKDADGYVPGDGVGVLLLQPLENALQAENHVYGVVRGSAVNHVGRALSITAPRVEAQRDVILAAYADGDLQPTMVSYVEAHGTGTSLGDPIEIEALTRAFRAHTQANHFCHIGSVKSNIGHLEAAAGVAGVIKVLLMMEQRQIVPSLNIRTPNPVIDFDESPFILARELQQWSSDGPLSAGVSSFGFGGVNSHVVIAACDEQTPTSKHFNTPLLQPPYVFVLSAKSASALQSTLSHWHQFIHETDFQNRELRDICATVATTRSAFSHRFGALVNNHQEIAESIQQACSTSLNDRPWEIHFDAWGDNPQQVADDPPARHKAVLESLGDKALVELLRVSGDDAMPSAFIWTYAYLQALLRLGFKPVSVSGEKDGLWLALVCSGMLCIDDALAVLSGSRPIAQLVVRRPCLPFLDPVTQQTLLPYQFDATYLALLLDGLKIDQANLIRNVERARLLQESQFTFKKYLDEWSVLLAKFGEQSLDDMLDTLVHTAQDDSQQNKALLMLILGSASQQLDKKWDLTSRPDVQSEAFQELLDLILDGVLPKEMVIELFSISGETDLDAAGAILNERQGHMSADRPYRLIAEYSRDCPVIPEFETWLARALDTECRLPSLTSTNRLVLSDAGSEQDVVEQVGVQLVLSPRAYVPESLLKLWLHGVPVEWQLVYPTGAFRKLPLPTYRFERSAFWIETMQRDEDQQEARQTTESEPIEETQSHALYHRLFWREQPEPLMDDRSRGPRALIFSDREGVAEALAQQHVQAAIVKPASAYARVGKDSYRIDIVKEQDYARILALDVEVVYYLWGITRYEIEDLGAFTAYQEHVIMPMFRLCRVLARHSKPLRLVVVSRQLHQVSGSESTLFPYAAPMLGTAKVLGRENPLIDVQCIDIPLSWTPRDIDLLARETSCPPFHEIAYRHGKRFIKTITTSSRLPASEEEPVVFKPGGVYLIVGGLGGIGFALSCYLTEHYRARLVLVGRSLLNREKEQQIETLQQLGGEVLYVNGDGSKLEDMTRAVQAAKERFGALHGCIHSALVMASGLLEDMTEAIFRQGLEPKSKGSYALHRATLGEHLDFLLFFSSFITFRGDQGVANYAAGCAFQDAFAHYLRTDCRRPGFVINWGHWGEIGIAANARFKQIIEKLDVDTLSTQQGLAGLSAVLAGEETQVMVARLGQTWTASCPADTVIKQSTSKQINALSQENSMTRQPPGTPKQQRKPDLTREQEPDRQRLLDMVVGIAAEALNVSEQDIGLDERFSEMGVDSILGVELVNKINERLGELVLNPTTIFDYPNVGRLVDYILDQSPRALEHAMPETAQAPKSAPKSAQESAQEFWSEERSQDTLEPTTQAHETRLRREDDIAVIGMSGQFPGANNVLEFWEIIAAGKNSISEVPASRWSLDEYYDPDWSAPNKTYCRHGGYLADIDKFDPLFFSISPKEAELMDPQQRLFLEHSWRAIEDAGYTAKGLSGQRVDIYVGIKHSEYFTDIVQSQYEMDAHVFLGNDAAILSARLAYFMDLNGPALAIDTACSSSLVAIHQACQQLRTGQVDVALAGGVMVMPTPQIHIMASKAGMLSPSGQCRTFDRDADGFVPAEGVGVLVLKPLAKAIEDNDHIYGVVKGSGINQDGKTNGITAPSTLSQSRLLLDVYGQAGIDPTTIGYVEAHGTGTKLGDPIEVTALTRAYQEYTDATQYCAIGSVKANIGHTQYAAGVAGVIKVLLAFERQQLPPAVNYQHPNEHIDFTKTPFYVNTRLRSWDSVGQPRRAAVSSFGFSGTNAHLVIEEFTRPGPVAEDSAQQPYLFLLSAKDAERLQDYARELRDFLVLRPETAMSELTYTLQVGREAMTERLAVVASSVDELVESLAAFVEDPAHVKGFRGNAAKDATQTRLLLDGAAGEAFLQVALEQRELGRLAQMWVSGVDIDWLLLYGENRPRRISLPTYPFARESYWIAPLGGSAQQTTRQITGQIAGARRHPLIDHIEPSLSYANPGLVFIKTIKPHDWIVNDHIVSGSPAFPGVGYLEMALAATLSIHAQARLGFRRVLWQQPLVIDTEPKTLRVHIVDQDGEMRYAIRDSEKLYATGLLTANRQPIAGSMDIEGVRSRCRNRLDKAAFYRRFAATGVHFGPRFQGVQEVWANAGEALARLALPIEASRESRAYRLHPSLMDSALQTVMAIGEGPRSSGPLVPFSMEQIELSGPLQADMYAYAKVDGEQRFQVLLLDNAGRVCVSCRDFVLRALPDRLSSFFYLPRWIARGTTGADQMPMGSPQSVLIVTGVTPLRLERAISACLPSADVRYLYLGTTTQALAEGHWEIEVTNPGAFDQHPQALGEPDCIYFLGGIQIEPIRLDDLSALEVAQQRGVLALFRLVKALIRHGLIKRRLQLKVLTNEVFQVRAGDRIKPFAAGLYGLSRALEKEYQNLDVSCIDLDLSQLATSDRDELVSALLPATRELPADNRAIAWRDGQCYTQCLIQTRLSATEHVPFRKRGVYVILGGAGGIGLQFSRYLANAVEARLVLIGRRELSEIPRADLEAIEQDGGQVLYLSADATNSSSMQAAIDQAKARFGCINGVVHSAIALHDRTLDNMDEETFRAALAPKVEGSLVLYQVLRHEPLDFMLFFSSSQSYWCNAGQSNYAAACTFKDAFANALAQASPCPVAIVNWGYWGDVGIVAKDAYRKRLAAQGFRSISSEEGMDAVRRVLHHGVQQVMAIHASDDILSDMGVQLGDEIVVYPRMQPSLFDHPLLDQLVPWLDRPAISSEQLLENDRASGELTRFGHDLVVDALQRMGVFLRSGEHYVRSTLTQQLNLAPAYHRLWEVLLETLLDAGFIEYVAADDGLVTTDKVVSLEAKRKTGELQQSKQRLQAAYPSMSARIDLLWNCVSAYPDVLTGRVGHMEALFPRGSMELVEGVYKDDPLSIYYNRLLGALVQQFIPLRLQQDQHTPISILEVGAGTGGSSSLVLAAIAKHAQQVRYIYTDISIGFTQYGERCFGQDYPFVEFKPLDIEKDPVAQGFSPGSIDLLFGTNVFHATRRIHNTVNNAKRLLKRNGLLVLNEITRRQEFTTLTFGLTDGWWLFEDEEVRCPGSPLLSVQQWTRVLQDCGLGSIHAVGLPDHTQEDQPQCVIVAESDGEVRLQKARDRLQGNVDVEPVPQAPAMPAIPVAAETNRVDLTGETLDYVRGVFADLLKVDRDRLDVESTFERYGVDSLVVLELNRRLEQDFGRLPATLLFERKTIAAVADYLVSEHRSVLEERHRSPDIESSGVHTQPIEERTCAERGRHNEKLDDADLSEQALDYVKSVFSDVLKIDREKLDVDTTLEVYGVDSLVVLEINRRLEDGLGRLPSTLLFEQNTMQALSEYLLKAKSAELQLLLGPSPQASMLDGGNILKHAVGERANPVGDVSDPVKDNMARQGSSVSEPCHQERETGPIQSDPAQSNPAQSNPVQSDMNIAIIGMTGRYPGAESLEQFWENLRSGKNCIREIPTERWRWQEYDEGESDQSRSGGSYTRWGGFIDDVDKFDPLFFGISPREAEEMDPQERLFLETVWALLEDAGYTRDKVVEMDQKVGTFVGVMNNDYEWVGAKASTGGTYVDAHSAYWSIANRISYFYDFTGPSLAVDTACSSSLTALHLACQSLKRGECDVSIVGAVNLILHPKHYLRLCQMKMLAADDRCKSFGEGGDGFVDGEGVGAVLLKPLAQALADGDNVLGVIKASNINASGKTSGYTVPNPNTQAALIEETLRIGGIDPRTIGYVEAHGTGTALGDPIEISGLTQAYRAFTSDRHYCAIGSVKSNVGHLESAAGLVGLTKVVLSMQHQQLVPSLHSERRNEHIDFEESPFYVQQELAPWHEPVIREDGREIRHPRRAGISSFGAGGANAHVILEEYHSPDERCSQIEGDRQLIVLSARNQERLEAVVDRLIDFLSRHWQEPEDAQAGRTLWARNLSLANLAYTLQTAREAMAERLAFTAQSIPGPALGLGSRHRLDIATTRRAGTPYFAADLPVCATTLLGGAGRRVGGNGCGAERGGQPGWVASAA
jgi:polyketide synthase PksM